MSRLPEQFDLIVQDNAEKRTVDFQCIVVVDEAEPAELVHEEVHS